MYWRVTVHTITTANYDSQLNGRSRRTFLVALDPRPNAVVAFRLPVSPAVAALSVGGVVSLRVIRWGRKDSSKTGNACLERTTDERNRETNSVSTSQSRHKGRMYGTTKSTNAYLNR